MDDNEDDAIHEYGYEYKRGIYKSYDKFYRHTLYRHNINGIVYWTRNPINEGAPYAPYPSGMEED